MAFPSHALGDDLRMAYRNHRRHQTVGSKDGILIGKLARRHTVLDHIAQDLGHTVEMCLDNRPLVFDGDHHHLMDFLLIEHRLDHVAVVGDHEKPDTVTRRNRLCHHAPDEDFLLRQHAIGKRLVNFGLRGKEPVDVGR